MAVDNEKTEQRAEQIAASVPEVQNEAAETAPEAAVQTAAPEEPSAPSEPSRRDRFRQGISNRKADLDMDDENAYYDYLDSQLSERDGYESKVNNLRDAMQGSPDFAEMLDDASQTEKYHPLMFLAKKLQSGEVTLEELQSGDFGDQIAKAQEDGAKVREQQKQIEAERAKNFDASLELVRKVQQEKGLSDDQVTEALGKMYQIMDDLIVNKVSEETFNAIVNSMNFEQAVSDARDEGRAEGMNTKVRDQLRRMPKSNERTGGAQAQAAPKPQAKKKAYNPFVDDDEM